jgi:hypothetical protein
MMVVSAGLDLHGWSNAQYLLDHWLDNSGTPYEIDPQKLMAGSSHFNADVQAQVAAGAAKGGHFDSGWRSGAVENDDRGTKGLDWYYALHGYQYRVKVDSVTTSHGIQENVTVDMFKRYNWGNPAGGKPRKDLSFPGGFAKISQNDVARLNGDGRAADFNVWGESTYTVG